MWIRDSEFHSKQLKYQVRQTNNVDYSFTAQWPLGICSRTVVTQVVETEAAGEVWAREADSSYPHYFSSFSFTQGITHKFVLHNLLLRK